MWGRTRSSSQTEVLGLHVKTGLDYTSSSICTPPSVVLGLETFLLKAKVEDMIHFPSSPLRKKQCHKFPDSWELTRMCLRDRTHQAMVRTGPNEGYQLLMEDHRLSKPGFALSPENPEIDFYLNVEC